MLIWAMSFRSFCSMFTKKMSFVAESIIYQIEKNQLSILNQLQLPTTVDYEDVHGVEDAWRAINQMKVRGAPAIAIVGLLGMAVELSKSDVIKYLDKNMDRLFAFVKQKAQYLCSSRPTAVNIRKEFDDLMKFMQTKRNENGMDFDKMIESIKKYCNQALELDKQTNLKIGEFGSEHIFYGSSKRTKKFNVLTHCNTGCLATAGYGTALGVIRSLQMKGLLKRAYCTETRPYNQGSRLTAWELVAEQIPSTLICDSMVAWLMKTKNIDAVVVGADRVAANGDTANKIGTFQIAILAKHFEIPFYVASPISTIDLSISDGEKIPIEERPDHEMKWIGKVQIAPTQIQCWNPAFDITPAELITGGIITERGVVQPDKLKTFLETN